MVFNLIKKNTFYFLLTCFLNIYCIRNYQEILINNEIIATGRVACQERYKAFKPILQRFQRPFTFLDIGASEGFFTFKTAYEFPHSVGIMIEGGYSYTSVHDSFPRKLLDLCKRNNKLNNIVFLRKQISVSELQKLSKCEHFDVIFVFNVLHHFKKDWKGAIDAIMKLGDHIIIELPDYSSEELQSYVATIAPKILGIFKHSINNDSIATMRYCQGSAKIIDSKAYGSEEYMQEKHFIKSDFGHKKIIKTDNKDQIISERIWIPGINLCTFKLLNGVWPAKNMLINIWNSLDSNQTSAWNVIVQGENLQILPNTLLDVSNISELLNATSMRDILTLLPYKVS